jgi:hydrogenase nickel incorporation protein HypA/HybF
VHELSLCADLLGQVEALAARHGAQSVAAITVRIGVLSGVEPLLLETAFSIARTGTVAENAALLTEITPPRIVCADCGVESEASPSHLRCPACQSGKVRLIQGEELILARVELMVDEPPKSPLPAEEPLG